MCTPPGSELGPSGDLVKGRERSRTRLSTLMKAVEAVDHPDVRPTRIEVGPGAAEFVHERGGRLYVWVSETGIEHETTIPNRNIDFIEVPGDDFTLYVDRSIEPPERWRLVFHRFPRPHVRALWNGTGGFSQPVGLSGSWEGAGFTRAPWTADE